MNRLVTCFICGDKKWTDDRYHPCDTPQEQLWTAVFIAWLMDLEQRLEEYKNSSLYIRDKYYVE